MKVMRGHLDAVAEFPSTVCVYQQIPPDPNGKRFVTILYKELNAFLGNII